MFPDDNYEITINLHMREFKVDIFDKKKKRQLKSFGFKLSEQDIEELIPYIQVADYEKYRDLDYKKYDGGYRDGWGIVFWCMSDTGNSLLQFEIVELYDRKNSPPFYRLWEYICNKYLMDKKYKKYFENTYPLY